MEVLVVDDEPRAVDAISRALRTEGVAVQIARTGRAALAALGRTRFDAIILDVDRQILDGSEFYRTLRALPRDVPVLVLSAGGAESASERLLGTQEHARILDTERLVDDVRRIGQAG
jgi:DNA-binding response OmpR family regulator